MVTNISPSPTYRYGDEHRPVTTADILTPRRREDYGKDLWSAYQTIQENMLKGGISGRNARGKRIHTRTIHSIDTDIKLNRERLRVRLSGISAEYHSSLILPGLTVSDERDVASSRPLLPLIYSHYKDFIHENIVSEHHLFGLCTGD